MDTLQQISSGIFLSEPFVNLSQVRTSSEPVTPHLHQMKSDIYKPSSPHCGYMSPSITRHARCCHLYQFTAQGRAHPYHTGTTGRSQPSETSMMPNYASSAPATDRPYSELEYFPTVANISKKVQMNPLATVFKPNSDADADLFDAVSAKPASASMVNMDTENAAPGSNGSSDVNEHAAKCYEMRPVEPLHQDASTQHDSNLANDQTLPAIYSESDFAYEPTTILPEYEPGSLNASFLPASDTTLFQYHQNAMSSRFMIMSPEAQMHAAADRADFEHTYQSRHDYQQPAMRSYTPLTLSTSTLLPPQQCSYYPTHLYGRPLPRSMAYVSQPAYHHDLLPFIPNGPLPPSYPFPHRTSPDRPLNQQAPRRFPLPYDNTAKATAYLQAFTDLYGTSATSIGSLQALCLILGHPNSEQQPLPKTIRKAQNYLKARFVNIFDLVDYGMRGEVIPAELVFATAGHLRRYSEDTKKICPASVGRIEGDDQAGNELWRWMLRKWY